MHSVLSATGPRGPAREVLGSARGTDTDRSRRRLRGRGRAAPAAPCPPVGRRARGGVARGLSRGACDHGAGPGLAGTRALPGLRGVRTGPTADGDGHRAGLRGTGGGHRAAAGTCRLAADDAARGAADGRRPAGPAPSGRADTVAGRGGRGGAGARGPAHGETGAWRRALLGGLLLGVCYLLLHAVNPRGLGLGDVKLAVGLGVALGWYGWRTLVTGGAAGVLSGALYGAGLLLSRRGGRDTAMPLGPFMIFGAFCGLLLGAAAAATAAAA